MLPTTLVSCLQRRSRLAMVALGAVVAAVAAPPATAGTGPAVIPGTAAVGAAPGSSAADGKAVASPALDVQSFAVPPAEVRPMYRWWMPLAYTDDEVLRQELRDIAAAGGGGVEVAPFVVPGPGNQSNAFLAEYGWGTPLWAHKMEVITAEAADLGLVVDQNLGPHYPPTVPTLNSFNQPEAEQQLIYGREFNAAGSSRTGPLPAPTAAPPSVATQLCGVAAPGDAVLEVRSLGGFAAGDTITVGSGVTGEEVVVTGLGDRTAACADLSVAPVKNAHGVGESVQNVARSTRLRTLVAQCAQACDDSTAAPVQLVPSSVTDVTAKVDARGNLDHAFGAGNGNPWVVIDFLQTASGLIAQRGGYTATQPNYVVDHWSRGGVDIQTDFWDENILTPAVRDNLARIGRGAVFEDSLELGETQKWTWGFLEEFADRRGYDPTTLLPALTGIGLQGTHTPAFELAGVGPQVREDYRQTLSDLFTEEYVGPMQRWAAGHGLDLRIQPYGVPASSGEAGGQAGVVEGESLNFGAGSNTFGAEQDYRVLSSGARLSGKDVVSVECCAVFLGNYRSSVAGPSVPGQFGEGGGSQAGGRYSNGLLDAVYKSYAGGVNQLVWHGYPYRDAPADPVNGRDGSWPGYHPWDIFNVLNVNDEFGPRQPNWPDYEQINLALARTQLVLRQGRSTVDLGVYYEDLGLAGASVGEQQESKHMLGTSSATAAAGYTYDYIAPAFLDEPGIVARDGGLFDDRTDQEALVLNNQTTMSVDNARRLLELARQGLRLFVVGTAPQRTTGADPDGGELAGVVEALLEQPRVVQVATEQDLPSALRAAGITPTVTPERSGAALGAVRREGAGVTYDFLYNRSGVLVDEEVTLSGDGTPYELNTWTGKVEAIGEYTRGRDGITLRARIAPYDAIVIALVDDAVQPVNAPEVHATSSSAEVAAADQRTLTLRVAQDGRYTTTLSDGRTVATTADGVSSARRLDRWTLRAQTWSPGVNQHSTVKTDLLPVAVTAGEDGRLPSWREMPLAASSGIGTYTAEIDLPASWTSADGAYVDLGAVLDTVAVTVNGVEVAVDQSDRGRIDLGKALEPGKNVLTVRVATTMFNAVRASGDSNYQLPDWQHTGLMGPVVLTPYRDIVLVTSGQRASTPEDASGRTVPQQPGPRTASTALPATH